MTAQALQKKQVAELTTEELFAELDRLQAEFYSILGRHQT